jgi:hypothetical protein
MLKLTAISLLLTAAFGGLVREVGAIRNVQPSGPRHYVTTDHTPTHIHAAKLNAAYAKEVDSGANRHHNEPPEARMAWVCGSMGAMVGAPHGKASVFYGRVATCSWEAEPSWSK